MMIANKNDKLVRDGIHYCVVCADEEYFIIGQMHDNITSFENLEAYSNIESINTLEELNFIKEN